MAADNLRSVQKSFNKPTDYKFALDGLASRGIYAITSFIFVTQRASWTRSRDDVSGEDQREVRKRLWEVSELALQPRIVLLREKPQVIS